MLSSYFFFSTSYGFFFHNRWKPLVLYALDASLFIYSLQIIPYLITRTIIKVKERKNQNNTEDDEKSIISK